MTPDLEGPVRYPDITVGLVGQNGNAFMILGLVIKALRAAEISKEEIELYKKDAMSGDYDHLLQVTMQWVDVE